MSQNLKVDPVDPRMSSDHMDMHHSELLAAHAAADSAIEEAQAGWVGSSATALQAKFGEWQTATAGMTQDIAAHGQAFRSAAANYEVVDRTSAAGLDDQLW